MSPTGTAARLGRFRDTGNEVRPRRDGYCLIVGGEMAKAHMVTAMQRAAILTYEIGEYAYSASGLVQAA